MEYPNLHNYGVKMGCEYTKKVLFTYCLRTNQNLQDPRFDPQDFSGQMLQTPGSAGRLRAQSSEIWEMMGKQSVELLNETMCNHGADGLAIKNSGENLQNRELIWASVIRHLVLS